MEIHTPELGEWNELGENAMEGSYHPRPPRASREYGECFARVNLCGCP